MNSKKVKISTIKNNPDNPREIKKDAMAKLIKSMREFPEMIDIKPIIVNMDNVVLAGNMRLQAAKELGLKTIPVIQVDLSEKKQREFVVKDNAHYGDWDYTELESEFDISDLTDWGVEIKEKPQKKRKIIFQIMCDSDEQRETLKEFFSTTKNRVKYEEFEEKIKK